MTLYEFLLGKRRDLPEWLEQYRKGASFPRKEFFASRIVYYPGAGTDGHPVKLFGSSHSAHCFVYADYGVSQQHLEEQLEDRLRRFRGYQTLDRIELRERDIVPNGWTPHVLSGDVSSDRFQFAAVAAAPFGFLEVLERTQEFDDNHGARRLAILFLGADGIATYDALFCQGHGSSSPPFAVLLQDHAFGGNYNKFGRDSLLERIAMDCHALPTWLLVAEYTRAWHGFRRVRRVDGDPGGRHPSLRFLYENCDERIRPRSRSVE